MLGKGERASTLDVGADEDVELGVERDPAVGLLGLDNKFDVFVCTNV